MRRLAAQPEVGDQFTVTLNVFFLQIAEQPAALADLHQKAAAAMVVLLVDPQVLGQLIDRSSEDGDLYVGRTGVVCATAVFDREVLLLLFGDGHEVGSLHRTVSLRLQIAMLSGPATAGS